MILATRTTRSLAVAVLFVLTCGAWQVLRAQRPFKEYPGNEYVDFPLPPDYRQNTDWTRARLR